jgi:hypothetical protein
LIYLLFITVLAVTAAFWAHTSHRSHMDVYLIVFAAAAIKGIMAQRVRGLEDGIAGFERTRPPANTAIRWYN